MLLLHNSIKQFTFFSFKLIQPKYIPKIKRQYALKIIPRLPTGMKSESQLPLLIPCAMDRGFPDPQLMLVRYRDVRGIIGLIWALGHIRSTTLI